jgi:hypothetical protein
MPVRRAPVSHAFEWDISVPVVDRQALDDLFSVTYEELRRLASSVRRHDRNASLSPTALVNEAWLKLANAPEFRSASRLHFKRIAARAMRQILIEAARRRRAGKRSGDISRTVTDRDSKRADLILTKHSRLFETDSPSASSFDTTCTKPNAGQKVNKESGRVSCRWRIPNLLQIALKRTRVLSFRRIRIPRGVHSGKAA